MHAELVCFNLAEVAYISKEYLDLLLTSDCQLLLFLTPELMRGP